MAVLHHGESELGDNGNSNRRKSHVVASGGDKQSTATQGSTGGEGEQQVGRLRTVAHQQGQEGRVAGLVHALNEDNGEHLRCIHSSLSLFSITSLFNFPILSFTLTDFF